MRSVTSHATLVGHYWMGVEAWLIGHGRIRAKNEITHGESIS